MDSPKAEISQSSEAAESHKGGGGGGGGGGGWTLPFLCAGIALLAVCFLAPEAQENQKLMWQCEQLRLDLDHIQRQSAANEIFISKLSTDPVLQTRLAERQLKYIERGAKVLDLGEENVPGAHSPYPMVVVDPSPELAEPTRLQGRLAQWIEDPKSRLLLIGSGLFLVAFGLIMGSERT